MSAGDAWYLLAGRPWPQALERALDTCRAAAVFVGPVRLAGSRHHLD